MYIVCIFQRKKKRQKFVGAIDKLHVVSFASSQPFVVVVSSQRSRSCSQPFRTASPGHIPTALPTDFLAVLPTVFPIIYVHDRFSTLFPANFPTMLPPDFPNIHGTGFTFQQYIGDVRPVPLTEWLPASPSHSRAAVSKRDPFPIPSIGKSQKKRIPSAAV